jgi:hypothetical protein
MPGRIIREVAEDERLELVVLELMGLASRPLLEHHDAEAGDRQLFRDDTARRTGADHGKIHRIARSESNRPSLARHHPAPRARASAS